MFFICFSQILPLIIMKNWLCFIDKLIMKRIIEKLYCFLQYLKWFCKIKKSSSDRIREKLIKTNFRNVCFMVHQQTKFWKLPSILRFEKFFWKSKEKMYFSSGQEVGVKIRKSAAQSKWDFVTTIFYAQK